MLLIALKRLTEEMRVQPLAESIKLLMSDVHYLAN